MEVLFLFLNRKHFHSCDNAHLKQQHNMRYEIWQQFSVIWCSVIGSVVPKTYKNYSASQRKNHYDSSKCPGTTCRNRIWAFTLATIRNCSQHHAVLIIMYTCVAGWKREFCSIRPITLVDPGNWNKLPNHALRPRFVLHSFQHIFQ
jgi:hypothetical protein